MRRPFSSPLTIHPPPPPLLRRFTFPFPTTATAISPSSLSPVAVRTLSYWSPDTSPFTPGGTTIQHTPTSPINPFLIPPPAQPRDLFRLASFLPPASPLSVFDVPISPGYVVSPMGSMCVVGSVGFSPLSMHGGEGGNMTFWIDVSPLSERCVGGEISEGVLGECGMSPLSERFPMSSAMPEQCGAAPLSPTFLGPRTPPVPVLARGGAERKASNAVQIRLGEMVDRKASIVSVLSMGQERMKMKVEFFQWLAVRRWEGMEGEKKSGWKRWTGGGWKMWAKVFGKEDGGGGRKERKKGLKASKDVVTCV